MNANRAAPVCIKEEIFQAFQGNPRSSYGGLPFPQHYARIHVEFNEMLASKFGVQRVEKPNWIENVDPPTDAYIPQRGTFYARTKPVSFPSSRLVLFARSTTYSAEETANQSGAGYALQGISIEPGKAVYATEFQVEFFSTEGNPDTEEGGEGLSGVDPSAEALNIICQNVIWAAYRTILDIGNDTTFEQATGLKLIEVSEGMHFDNTRGEEFPVTEYGTFAFTAFVG